ncbi:hypothetical protein BH10ACI2_BH10ACI2_00310 [soil metagenome]
MTNSNDTYTDDLNQIRERQTAVLDEIDEIQKRHGVLPHEIEKLQSDALSIIYDIDEIKKRREDEVQTHSAASARGSTAPMQKLPKMVISAPGYFFDSTLNAR